MSRRMFAIGAWVLLALGAVHLLGHMAMLGATGANDGERQMLELMRSQTTDFGAGFVRSMMDILSGFSLTFSILPAGIGLLDLVLLRHERDASGLLRSAAIVNAGTFGVMTGVALRYWFPAPLAFLAVAFLCFAVAAGAQGRASPRGGVR